VYLLFDHSRLANLSLAFYQDQTLVFSRMNIGLDIVSIMEVVTTGTANLRRMVQLPQLGKLKKIKSSSWITTVIAFATLASVFYFSVIWIILFWKNVSIVVNKLNVRKLVRNASSIFVLVVMILSKFKYNSNIVFYCKILVFSMMISVFYFL